ncbi:MAG: lecithin retinol acyltransferase family protein [Clostridia bacterium]|nr:lecithin retinol acyltransferase family protein [Clostridia bacterium]
MKWIPGECRTGDMIRVRIGSIYHYGIFVSDSEVIAFGLPPTGGLFRDDAEIRVISTDIDVFSAGKIVETGVCEKGERKSRFSPEETVSRARSRLGEGGYSLLHNNCEHFVWECAMGKAKCTAEETVRRHWEHLFSGKNKNDKIPVKTAEPGGKDNSRLK